MKTLTPRSEPSRSFGFGNGQVALHVDIAVAGHHGYFNSTAIYIDVVDDEERKLASRTWLKEDL